MKSLLDKKVYLISAETYMKAVKIAKEKGIQPDLWKWVPVEKGRRYEAIAGHKDIPAENLLGDFDEEEKRYLSIAAKEAVEPKKSAEPSSKITINIQSDHGLATQNEST